ncbi:MAG TPA: ATPase, T2SS/T4P/T4SS family [Actinomycetota bacterium]|nr:ATPase, T2SS/T4P/T4SS family [Actinomycetota bacterium]
MNGSLRDLLLEHDELAQLDPARRRLELRRLVGSIETGEGLGQAVATLADDIDGYGPVSRLLRDDQVTDVLINGPFEIWVERAGLLELTETRFESHAALRSWVERNLGRSGARADAARPVADARLPDGSRMHVVLPPLAPSGPLVSIRRFPRRRFDLEALTAAGMLDRGEADYLRNCVADRISVAISGSTASGKTTLLNALLGLVDPGERVVLIEEVPELSPACRHFVSLVARSENVEGRGAVGLDALLRAALRMRPDRIVLGEVRGPEALVALGALSTGHEGSMVTLHAASASQVMGRMVTLALQGASGASEDSLRSQFEDAFGAVVHLERTAGGRRASEIIRRA